MVLFCFQESFPTSLMTKSPEASYGMLCEGNVRLFVLLFFSTAELSFLLLFQQALNEELAAKKEQVSEAIKTSQIFLAKHSHK